MDAFILILIIILLCGAIYYFSVRGLKKRYRDLVNNFDEKIKEKTALMEAEVEKIREDYENRCPHEWDNWEVVRNSEEYDFQKRGETTGYIYGQKYHVFI